LNKGGKPKDRPLQWYIGAAINQYQISGKARNVTPVEQLKAKKKKYLSGNAVVGEKKHRHPHRRAGNPTPRASKKKKGNKKRGRK